MRRRLGFVALVVVTAVVIRTSEARAAEWDTIEAGVTTTEGVRAQLGPPSRTEAQKMEGYDTTSWTYEGQRAPKGIIRAVVDFGLLTPQGFRPNVVRVMRIEPKPGVFNRIAVVNGWGEPSRIGHENDVDVFLYGDGLVVYFDKEGESAALMIFTPPQPRPSQAPTAPR